MMDKGERVLLDDEDINIEEGVVVESVRRRRFLGVLLEYRRPPSVGFVLLVRDAS